MELEQKLGSFFDSRKVPSGLWWPVVFNTAISFFHPACHSPDPGALVPTSQSDGGGVGHDLSKTFFGKLRLRFIRKEKRM